MGIFEKLGFKQAKPSMVEEVYGADEVQSAPKQSKRSKNDTLSSVLGETVFMQNMTDLRELPQFKTNINGQDYYACWMLDVATIGGLSKRTNRDEAKGQLIESLKSARIKHILTPALLEAECIVFVGDADSVEAMEESSILADAEYTMVFVQASGDIEDFDANVTVSLSDLQGVSSGSIGLDDLLQDVNGPWSDNMFDVNDMIYIDDMSEDDFQSPELNVPEVFVTAEDVADGGEYSDEEFAAAMAAYGQVPASGDTQEIPFTPAVSNDTIPAEVPASTEQNVSAPVEVPSEPVATEQPAPESVEPEPAPVLTQQEVLVGRELVERRVQTQFNAHGLELVLSTDRFEDSFGSIRPLALPTNRTPKEDGFLAEHLNVMCENANTELERLHTAHMFELLTKFNVVGGEIISALSTKMNLDSPETVHGKRFAELDKFRDAAERAGMIQQRDALAVLDAQFEEKVKSAGEAARVRAEEEYRTRYGKTHEADKRRAAQDVSDRIEQDYRQRKSELVQLTQRSAETQLEAGIESLMKILIETYRPMRQREEQAYMEFQDKIDKYARENADNEIDYGHTVKREQQLQVKLSEMQESVQIALDEKTRECDQRVETLRNQMKDAEELYESQKAERERTYEHNMNLLQEQNEKLESHVDELVNQIEQVRKDTKAEYEHRLAVAADDRRAANERFNVQAEQHKRVGLIGVALAIMAIVAAGCVGVIVGMNQNLDYSVQAVQSAYNTILMLM